MSNIIKCPLCGAKARLKHITIRERKEMFNPHSVVNHKYRWICDDCPFWGYEVY